MRTRKTLFVLCLPLLGLAGASATSAVAAPIRHPGEPRAWELLARAAAWSDSMRSPRASYWLEYRTPLACGLPGRGTRDCVVRIARAADGRVAWDVWMEPGPAGVRVRYDGHRYIEYSLWGGNCIVADTPPESVKTSLAGEAGGFAASMALGILATAVVTYDSSRAARRVGVESVIVDGRARRCERVRIGPHPGWRQPRAEDVWIDTETGCPWRHASVDTSGRPVREDAAGYTFVRMEVPPDSCFDTGVPADARILTGHPESTRPHPQVDGALAPRIQYDSTATFRWSGEARSVALVGSFNCWDTHADPMERGADGVWARTRSVDTRMFNDYLFVVDGTRYVMDPFNPSCRGDGFGGWVSCLVALPRER